MGDVAVMAGLSVPVVRAVMRAPRGGVDVGVDAVVAARVLSVSFGPVAGFGVVSAVGCHRRLRGLVAMGWPVSVVAGRVGVSVGEVEVLLGSSSGVVSVVVWRRVVSVFDELCMRPGPDVVVRDRARGDGWAAPLAWDDEELDDPRARPHAPVGLLGVDEVAIERRLTGDRTVVLSPDDVDVILGVAVRDGWEAWRLADVLASSVGTASRRLNRYLKRVARTSEDADLVAAVAA